MNIRPATMNDGPDICEMAARFMETTVYGKLIAWEPGPLADLVYAVLEQGTIFVAEERVPSGRLDPGEAVQKGLIGMIALVPRTHPMNHSRYADELCWWVEPEHRGGSAADRLLSAAEQWARENRLSVLKMVAPAGSELGKHYERRGFALVESTYQKTL
jgi:GNAT superfamily N-acetyltransferase